MAQWSVGVGVVSVVLATASGSIATVSNGAGAAAKVPSPPARSTLVPVGSVAGIPGVPAPRKVGPGAGCENQPAAGPGWQTFSDGTGCYYYCTAGVASPRVPPTPLIARPSTGKACGSVPPKSRVIPVSPSAGRPR